MKYNKKMTAGEWLRSTKKNKFLQIFQQGLNISDALKAIKCNKRTWIGWVENDEEFGAKYHAVRQRFIDDACINAISKLKELIDQKSFPAIKFILNAKDGWVDNSKQEVETNMHISWEQEDERNY